MPRLTVDDTPQWLREFLVCPECQGPCWLTTSGGMSCRASPGHTGIVREADWHEKVTAEYALVYGQNRYGQNRTVLKLEQVLWLAGKWLESQKQWKKKPVSQEGEKK